MNATPNLEPLLGRLTRSANECLLIRSLLDVLLAEEPRLRQAAGPRIRLWLEMLGQFIFASSEQREHWLAQAADAGLSDDLAVRLKACLAEHREAAKHCDRLLKLARDDIRAAARKANCSQANLRQLDELILKFTKESTRANASRGALIEQASQRIELLSRKMLRRSSLLVRGNAQTGDVFVGAAMRMMRALGHVSPLDPREFFGLVGLQIRRELIDVARQFKSDVRKLDYVVEPRPRRSENQRTLECWTRFHTAVDRLPPVQKEVVSCHWYQGLTLEQIAEVTGLSKDVVRRRWRAARDALAAKLEDSVSVMLEE